MQKTFYGQTAGGILRSAKLVKMQAGNVEIVVHDKRGREFVAMLGERPAFCGGTIRDVLVLTTFEGVAARIETSAMAYDKLVALEAQADKARGV